MVGERCLKEEILRLATEEGIADHVRLVGYRDSREVLGASDVFVLPSPQEGSTLVVVEAMACGIVPVRTPAAGASEQSRMALTTSLWRLRIQAP